jgi:hypothetical protein
MGDEEVNAFYNTLKYNFLCFLSLIVRWEKNIIIKLNISDDDDKWMNWI